RFLGEVRGDDKADLLAAADLLVFPSRPLPDGRDEGAPVVLREALAAGLPIVATVAGDAAELLAETGAGIVVPPSAPALAAALRALRDDPALLARHAAAARAAGASVGWE